MELIIPDIGLIFWMTISFLLLLWVLKKFAWKPVLKMLKDREESIDKALKSADEARAEMANLQAKNTELLQQAQEERAALLSEAMAMKNKMLEDAKASSKAEADRIFAESKQLIEQERVKAMNDLKKEVADLSILVAAKILKDELSVKEKAAKYTEQVISELNL
ncbi:MAG: F0F1 ATP synthase subunit B [Bacteroidales bacterium]|nr:F0F1 ATP synthase subunit B [Bacteroidales bacterium]